MFSNLDDDRPAPDGLDRLDAVVAAGARRITARRFAAAGGSAAAVLLVAGAVTLGTARPWAEPDKVRPATEVPTSLAARSTAPPAPQHSLTHLVTPPATSAVTLPSTTPQNSGGEGGPLTSARRGASAALSRAQTARPTATSTPAVPTEPPTDWKPPPGDFMALPADEGGPFPAAALWLQPKYTTYQSGKLVSFGLMTKGIASNQEWFSDGVAPCEILDSHGAVVRLASTPLGGEYTRTYGNTANGFQDLPVMLAKTDQTPLPPGNYTVVGGYWLIHMDGSRHFWKAGGTYPITVTA